MRPFTYSRAASASEATAAHGPYVDYLAGGTNQVDLMKLHIREPEQVVDIRGALSRELQRTPSGIRIGAAASNTAIAMHPVVQAEYPLLRQAILAGATPQIRNMATAGGNMLQRTRCPYFTDISLPCNKRAPGSGCGAYDGLNRTHAIVGYSPQCVAVHPSDFCVALAAYDAEVGFLAADATAHRRAFGDLHRLPGEDPTRDTTLPPGALITHIDVASMPFGSNTAYVKVRDRDSYAFALVSVAAALVLEGDRIQTARLASGGVAHKPWRWIAAEAFLAGKRVSQDVFAEAADIATNDLRPLAQNGYKVPMLYGTIVEALTIAHNA